ncbi:ATP-binding cassette domain-containing protein, partial [Campylobacter jejuni]|nr:ATP-binding cassette domain-containing protein [Campylobacter jejuni]
MSILKIENLQKYYGLHHALKDINLEVKAKEVVVILGPSGCGKSTLLRCINGLEEIASGNIYIDNEKIDKDFKEWPRMRQKVGMVFQSYELFEHLSVEENIL